jgi:hypothetical protein
MIISAGVLVVASACGLTTANSKHDRGTQVSPDSSEISSNRMGNEVGNGGDGVACIQDDRTVSIELFDFYESRMLRQIEPRIEPVSEDPFVLARFVMDRLQKLDPEIGDDLLNIFGTFKDDMRLVDLELRDVPDQGEIEYEPGCGLVQVAVQKDPEFPLDKRYTINQNYWLKMSPNDQAGLIVHEIVYRYLIARGQRDSKLARYFNSIISSSKMDAYTIETFHHFLEQLNIARKVWFEDSGAGKIVYWTPWAEGQEVDALSARTACKKRPGFDLAIDMDARLFPSAGASSALWGPLEGRSVWYKKHIDPDNVQFASVKHEGNQGSTWTNFPPETGLAYLCAAELP